MRLHLLMLILLIVAVGKTQGQSCKAVAIRDTAHKKLPFDNLVDDIETITAGNPVIIPGVVEGALYLDGESVASLGNAKDECFYDPGLCYNGATLAFWLQYKNPLAGDDKDAYILSNGGQPAASYGWAIRLTVGATTRLNIYISTRTTTASFQINNYVGRDIDWHHIVLVVDTENAQVHYYEDGTLQDTQPITARQFTSTTAYTEFLFGAPNHNIDTTKNNGRFLIDEMLFWESVQDGNFITELYDSYVSNLPACVAPAICENGACTCPDGKIGIDCSAILTFTTNPDTSAPIPANTDVEFSCTGTSDPLLNLWLHDLTSDTDIFNGVTETGSFTSSQTLTSAHNGHTFACRATGTEPSYYMEATYTYTFNIEYPPESMNFTTNTSTGTDQSEGTLVEFTCAVDANPAPMLSVWTRDEDGTEEKIFEQTSAELTFDASVHLTKQHHGIIFFCRAVGSSYTLTSDTTYMYNVKYAAETLLFTSDVQADNAVSENTVITLTCSADSYPLPLLAIYSRDHSSNTDTMHASGTQLELKTSITLTKTYNADDFYCKATGVDPVFTLRSSNIRYNILYVDDTVQITTNPSSPVSEGTVIQFDCSFDANPLATLSVMRSDGEAEEEVTGQSVTDSSFSLSVALTRHHHLSDFYCLAAGPNSEYQKESVRVTYNVTYEANEVTLSSEPLPDEALAANTEVVLTCSADGNPSPLLSLYTRTTGSPDVEQYTQAAADPTLITSIILTPALDDQDFVCKAQEDSYTLESETLAYRVIYGPQDWSITTDQPASSVDEGTQVTFTCSVAANPEPILCLMFTDGSTTQQISEQSITGLVFDVTLSLTRQHNGGSFFCRAKGEDPSYILDSQDTVSYNVNYPPSVTTISANPLPEIDQPVNAVVQITCSADAYPLPSLSLWTTDTIGQTQLVYEHSTAATTFTTSVTLTVGHNEESFFCRAEEGMVLTYEVDSESISFNAQYEAPDVDLSSDVDSAITQPEGVEVTFTCTVDGNPVPQISLWVMDGNGLEMQASGEVFTRPVSIFTISLTREYHGKSFFCKATNDELQYTLHSNTMEYSITYEPSSVGISSSLLNTESVDEGTLVQFICSTDAHPEPILSLMALNQSGNEYVIENGQAGLEVKATVTTVKTLNENMIFCRATAQDGSYTIDSDVLPFTVHYMPETVEILTDIISTDVNEETEVIFSCVAEANPSPQLYLMFRNTESTGQLISDQSISSSTFSVPVVLTREQDGWEFFCRAVGEDPSYTLNSLSTISYNVLYNVSHVTITTEPGTDMSQQLNAVVEITCSADSNPLSYLSLWLFTTNNNPVTIASSPDAMATFTTSVTLTENHNEKDFFCRASGANGAIEVDSDTVHFEVYYRAPSVTISANIDTIAMAPEGTDVIFTCTVDNNPVPQLSLYIRQSTGEEIPTGQAITDSSANFSITLNRNHNGQAFFCKATNTELQYTIHSDAVELSVQYAATEVLLETDTLNRDIVEVDTVVHFTCTSDANPDPLLSLWAVDQKGVQYLVLENNEPTSSMTETVTLATKYNKHLFFCRSAGQDGSYNIDSNTIRYEIKYIAETLNITTTADLASAYPENTEVEITCSTDAYPLPRLSLLARDDNGVKEISEQFQTSLEFVSSVTLTRESAGLAYFCKAQGTEPEYVIYSASLEFNVTYAASEVAMSSSHSTLTTQLLDTDITFTCTTDSNPPALLSLMFHKDATTEEIISVSENILTLTVSLQEQFSGGIFYCTAQGSDPHVFSIDSVKTYTYNIKYAPETVEILSNTNSADVTEGSEVIFTCIANASPSPQFYLMFRNVESTEQVSDQSISSSTFSVPVVLTREHDGGDFFCRAVGEDPSYTLISPSTFSYNVLYNASLVTITTEPGTEVSQPLSAVVEITCSADSNPLSFLSLWLFTTANNPVIIESSLDAVPSFTTSVTLTKSHNDKDIFCRASAPNGAFVLDSDSVNFQVLYTAPSVTISANIDTNIMTPEGTDVIFTCAMDSNPVPQLSLYIRQSTGEEIPTGQVFTDSSANFSITLNKNHNEQAFFCKATNTELQYTIHSDAVELSVQYAAETILFTYDVQADNAVSENTVVTLTCSADSYPLPSLAIYSRDHSSNMDTMHTSGTQLELQTSITLTKAYNANDFYCKATGSDPTFTLRSSNIRYDILYVDDTVQITTNPSSPVSEDTVVQFDCSFDANPLGTLSVMRSDGEAEEQVTGQSVTDSSFRLSVALTRHHHLSDFYCVAAGPNSEYQKESVRLTYNVTYDANEVALSSEPLPHEALAENTEVVLACSADGNPSPLLSLYTRTTGSPDVVQNMQAAADPTLTTSVTLSPALDNQDFVCKAQGKSYSLESEALAYRIIYGPQDWNITTDQPASSVDEGTQVIFTCSVAANPEPILCLMFTDGSTTQQISEQSVTGLVFDITLSLTRQYNGGSFFCRAKGENPSYILDSQDTVSYNVNYPPSVTMISTNPRPDIDQPVNAVVQVTCSADAYPLPLLSLWTTDTIKQTQLVYNHTTAATTFTTSFTLTEGHNEESFFCRAEEETVLVYEVDSESVSFNVQYEAPHVVLSSDVDAAITQPEITQVTFTCTVDGNPVPQISLWVMDGNGLEIQASGEEFARPVSVFTITLTRENHGKSFFCKATNDEMQYTLHSNTIEYSIIYEPSSVGILSPLLNTESVDEGTLIQFICSTDAHPEPVLSLMALNQSGNEYVIENSQAALEVKATVTAVKTLNENMIFCRATAQDGSYTIDSDVLPFRVHYMPETVEILSDINSADVNEGTEVIFSCVAEANPNPQLYLMFRNTESTGQVISEQSISSTTFSVPVVLTRTQDGGDFFCRAVGEDPSYTLNSPSTISYNVLYNVSHVAITTEPGTEVSQQVNAVVEIICSTDSNPLSYLSLWLVTNNSPVLIASSPDAMETFTTSVTLTENYNEKDFFCRASGANGAIEVDSDTLHFEVYYRAPSVTISANIDTNTMAAEGTDVIFTCTVESNPVPQQSLYIRQSTGEEIPTGQAFTDSSANFSITLNRNHNGQAFFCKATNTEWQYTIHSDAVEFSVQYAATEVLLETDTLNQDPIEVNTVVHLTCSSDANPDPLLSLWAVDQNGVHYLVLQNDEPTSTMTETLILAAQFNRHLFFCRASGQDGSYSIDSNTLRYDIQYAAETLTISTSADLDDIYPANTEVEITCTTDAWPLPKLSLLARDSNGVKEISEQFQTTLEFVSSVTLTRESSGLAYFCRAEGTEPEYVIYSSSLEFNVEYAALDVTLSSSHSTLSMLPLNTDITFTCTTDSNPPPLLSLMFNNGVRTELSSITGNTLSSTLSFQQEFSDGIFYCTAHGSNPQPFNIDSLETYTYTIDNAPQIVEILSDLNSTDVTEGSQVIFTCVADANPSPHFYLMFRNTGSTEQVSGQSISSSTFSVPVVLTREHDGGDFFCRAVGEDPDYILNSPSTFSYNVLYDLSHVAITTEPGTDVFQPISGVVEITCSADSNPLSFLSLWSSTINETVIIASSPIAMETFTTSVTLTENNKEFFCRASGSNGSIEVDSETVNFQGLYRASSVILSTNIDTNTMAPEGTDVIFTCTVDSNPVPQLSLYIRQSTGEEIPTGQAFTDSSATFLITLNRNHNGQAFFCKATNTELQYTIHSDPVELSVQYAATEVLLESDTPNEDMIEVDTVVHFTCTSDANPDPLLSLWAVDQNRAQYLILQKEDPEPTMTEALTLAAKYNKHLFFCRSAGQDGSYSIDSNTIRYEVQYAADTLAISTTAELDATYPENTEVEITCAMDAYPLPRLSLMARDDNGLKEISEQFETTLEFVSSVILTRESIGLAYFCRAQGMEPEYVLYSESLEFNVQYAASSVTMSSSHSTLSTLPLNTDITFTCTTDSNPPALLSLMFRKDETTEEILSVSDNMLTSTVSLQQQFSGGIFYCTAQGSDPQEFSIDSVETYTYTIESGTDMTLPLALGIPLGALFLLGLGIAACVAISKSSGAALPTPNQSHAPSNYYSDMGQKEMFYRKQNPYPNYFRPSLY